MKKKEKNLSINKNIITSIDRIDNCDSLGYCITLDKKSTITFVISGGQQCCEDYGSEILDNSGTIIPLQQIQNFVGSKVKNVQLIKNNEEKYSLSQRFSGKISAEYNEYCDFIKIITDKGDLLFILYNFHNGYYGHDIKVFAKNFNINYENTL